MYQVEVLIEHPIKSLDRPFSYLSMERVQTGVRVKVPFQRQNLIGYVEACHETSLSQEALEKQLGYPLKMIEEVIDARPLLTKELDLVASYLAKITLAPKISCLFTMLPPTLKPNSQKGVGIKYERYVQAIESFDQKLTPKQKACFDYLKEIHQPVKLKEVPFSSGIIKRVVEMHALDCIDMEIYRQASKEYEYKEPTYSLNSEQLKAVEGICENKGHRVCLLHGVTGSGKTEVYLHAAKRVIEQGKNVIVLVPEISLTPMMVERFKERFGPSVALLHSRLSQGEKYDEYRRIVETPVRIVVGARSAIFAPVDKVGLIIMDEEHDNSYKQDSNVRYHTRDIALFRAKYHHCPLVLGSATPSIETYARAKKGTYELYSLKHRVHHQVMPHCDIVDMVKEVEHKNYSIFSNLLKQRLQTCLNRHEQAILLLNRRGYSNFVQCKECGHVIKCPHCDVTLTYHKDQNELRCHYCDYRIPFTKNCPNCHSTFLQTMGYGTQKIEELLNQEFPQARILRMDNDTTRKKGSHEKIIEAFKNQEADILLGTQMIAKGLDFENVTFVGVLNSDQTLNMPDFRANEKTFQLLCQVSGRSGRGKKSGSVVIQTYNPTHYAIECASKHDYISFFNKEIQYRYYGNYPPYCRLAYLEIRSKNLNEVQEVASRIETYLKKNVEHAFILGPAPALISKLNDRYRYAITVKYKESKEVYQACLDLNLHYNKENQSNVSLIMDFNPYFIG